MRNNERNMAGGIMAETQAPPKADVEGMITRILFPKPGDPPKDDGFIIAVLSDGTKITGNIINPQLGQTYALHGKWVEHPRFGRQFKFHRFASVLPKTTDGIVRYLCNTAKWVGLATATAMIDEFGTDTLEILKSDPDLVARKIKGITSQRAREVRDHLVANEEIESAAVELEGMLGPHKKLPKKAVGWLLQNYGSNAPEALRKDPYILTKIKGVGFPTADAVALGVNHDKKSHQRQAAATMYALKIAADRGGHTFLLEKTLLEETYKLIGYRAEAGLELLLDTNIAWSDGKICALTSHRKDERTIAESVLALMAEKVMAPSQTPEDDLADDQKAAAQMMADKQICILTGPPGSGKTFLFARVVQGLKAAGYHNIAYAAPTGKAAVRMTESMIGMVPGAAACTIHRLLMPQMVNDEFVFMANCTNPMSWDVVLIDETSMLDSWLGARLFEAITPKTRVILVGDPDQLPPVGAGCVLKDLIAAGVPHVTLNEIKRNAGRIVKSCHKIKDGKPFTWSPKVDLEAGENLRHLERGNPTLVGQDIVGLVTKKAPELGFDPVWDVQVISPVNERTAMSCKALNAKLAEALNPSNPPIPGLPFRVKDKVVRTKNGVVSRFDIEDFDKHDPDGSTVGRESEVTVVNGDMGQVICVTKKYVYAKLFNPDRYVKLSRGEHLLAQAYCITVHKCQGSDAPMIIFPVHRSLGTFPTRELLYTAISRAKILCVTIGQQSAALAMVNRVTSKRNTMLTGMIKEGEKDGAD